jgi:hypothetical protein
MTVPVVSLNYNREVLCSDAQILQSADSYSLDGPGRHRPIAQP